LAVGRSGQSAKKNCGRIEMKNISKKSRDFQQPGKLLRTHEAARTRKTAAYAL
jgi:hypothetical protein